MGVHLNFRVGEGDGDNMCGDGGGDGDREDGDGVGMGTISRGWGGDGVVSSSPCQSLLFRPHAAVCRCGSYTH